MPCNSDYLAPTGKEKQMQDAARYQVVVRTRLNMTVPAWLKREVKNIYAADERNVTELCRILTEMGKEARDKLLYSDAKDAKIRDVAAWWEEHEKADKARVKKEKAEAKTAKTKKEALAKLNPAERKALGYK